MFNTSDLEEEDSMTSNSLGKAKETLMIPPCVYLFSVALSP